MSQHVFHESNECTFGAQCSLKMYNRHLLTTVNLNDTCLSIDDQIRSSDKHKLIIIFIKLIYSDSKDDSVVVHLYSANFVLDEFLLIPSRSESNVVERRLVK